MQIAKVNGAELSYVSWGTGPEALLCIPGAIGTPFSHYKAQLDYFGREGSGFRIVSFTPRGYEQDSKVERPTENALEIDAVDAVELMKFLSIEKFSVLGWCDGGITGILLAAKFPQFIQKLVVFGTRSFITKEELQPHEALRFIENWPNPKALQNMLRSYNSSTFQRLWSNWLDSFNLCYTKNAGDLCTKELSKVKCPMLIIHGKLDGMCPLFHGEYLRDHVQGSRLEVLKKGKHMPHYNFHHKFNKLVEEFLLQCC